jgi:NADH-quinone oxidoreductase subunit N
MPPSAVPLPTLALRDFHALAPEIILGLWGLLVLMADLTVFGKLSVDGRRKAAGRLSLVGIALALGAAFIPLFVRYNIYGYAEKLNFAGFDYLASPDPSLFFGTLSDDC